MILRKGRGSFKEGRLMNFHKNLIIGISITILLLSASISMKSMAGAPIARDFIVYQGAQDQITPSTAFNPVQKEYMVAWSNDRPGNDDIYARRLSAHGRQIGEWFAVAAGVGFERRNPDITYNSALGEYLVVWEEEPHGGYLRINGMRVANNGQLIPPVLEISSGPALKNCQKPSVAYSSSSDTYLVVWESLVSGAFYSTVEGQLLSSSGASQGANFQLSEAIGGGIGFSDGNPDLTYNRSRNEFLAVFERTYDSKAVKDIYGRLVTGSGTPLDGAAKVISGTSDDKLNPAAAAIPTVAHEGKFFVAWESQYSAGNNDIYGKRFKHDLSGDGIILWLSGSQKSDWAPAVAADEYADRFLIAWSQPADVLATSQIFATYVSQSDDNLGDDIPVGGYQTGFSASNPAISAGLPGDFLVTFQDTAFTASDSDIFGQILGLRQYIPLAVR
jgi:hypothetical protein